MTAKELQEIEVLHRAATTSRVDGPTVTTSINLPDGWWTINFPDWNVRATVEAKAAFYTRAHIDIPRLVEAVRTLTALCQNQHKELERLRGLPRIDREPL